MPNIKPARRVTRDFDLWNKPFDDDPKPPRLDHFIEAAERELRLLERVPSPPIIVAVCIALLASCPPAPAAGFDQYEADRRADARQEEADRRADDGRRRAEAPPNLCDFRGGGGADAGEFTRRYEAVGTERDPYYRHHRR